MEIANVATLGAFHLNVHSVEGIFFLDFSLTSFGEEQRRRCKDVSIFPVRTCDGE